MATKQIEQMPVVIDVQPSRIPLSPSKQKFLNRLIAQMARTEDALKAAQDAVTLAQSNHDTAQANANEYLFCCAEEEDVRLGENGWSFVQSQMAFVRQEQEG